MSKIREELAANHIVHDKVEILGVLQRYVKIHHKGVLDRAKDILFSQDMINLLHAQNLSLLQQLDCIVLLCMLVFTQPNTSKRAGSWRFQQGVMEFTSKKS